MTKNKDSTRYYSRGQEDSVAKALGGVVQANSGAAKFVAGDVVLNNFLIECKTNTVAKDSKTIKKEWVEKNRKECHMVGKDFGALCFNFEPGGENFYVIDESLMILLKDTIDSLVGGGK